MFAVAVASGLVTGAVDAVVWLRNGTKPSLLVTTLVFASAWLTCWLSPQVEIEHALVFLVADSVARRVARRLLGRHPALPRLRV